jgi:hypothetical protein
VTELAFHQELYDGFAIDEAVKVYADYAGMDLERKEGGYIVRVTAHPSAIEQGIDESVLCGEILNYALGKTIERHRATGGAGGAA